MARVEEYVDEALLSPTEVLLRHADGRHADCLSEDCPACLPDPLQPYRDLRPMTDGRE